VLIFVAAGVVVAGITYAISLPVLIAISLCLFVISWVLILKLSRI
jgi:hypothetical protein